MGGFGLRRYGDVEGGEEGEGEEEGEGIRHTPRTGECQGYRREGRQWHSQHRVCDHGGSQHGRS